MNSQISPHHDNDNDVDVDVLSKDRHLLQCFDSADHFVRLQATLHDLLADAYLHLARERYVNQLSFIGLSRLLYDNNEFMPSQVIDVDMRDGQQHHPRQPSWILRDLKTLKAPPAAAAAVAPAEAETISQRRRSSEDEDDGKDKDPQVTRPPPGLRYSSEMFGACKSVHVRAMQANFQKALQVIVQLYNNGPQIQDTTYLKGMGLAFIWAFIGSLPVIKAHRGSTERGLITSMC